MDDQTLQPKTKDTKMDKTLMKSLFAGVRKPAKQISNNIIVFTDREREPLRDRTIQSYARLDGELTLMLKHYNIPYLLISHSYSDKQHCWDRYRPEMGNTIRVRCDHTYGWGSHRNDKDYDERLLKLINDQLLDMANHRHHKLMERNDSIFNRREQADRRRLQKELDAKLDKLMKPYKSRWKQRAESIKTKLPEVAKLETHNLMRDNTYRFSIGLRPRGDIDETEE